MRNVSSPYRHQIISSARRKRKAPKITVCPYCGNPSDVIHQSCLEVAYDLQNQEGGIECKQCEYEMLCSGIVFDTPFRGEQTMKVRCEAPEAFCKVNLACKRGAIALYWYWTEKGEVRFAPLTIETKPKLAVPCCEKCRAAMESQEAVALLGVEL